MTDRRKAARAAVLALLFVGLLDATTTLAQVTTGTIAGTVKDAHGGAVAGATVTITEVDKGTRSTVTTDATGSYNAPFLIPGTYEVAIEATGFKKLVRRGVVLQVNERARVDASLAVGTFAETTEVTALAPLTRSDSAELGEVIEERAVRELPLNGRTRRFPIKGNRVRLQFRADAFNLLNTPQFGFPNANIGSPTAGRITSMQPDIGNRQMQFSVRLDF